MPAEKWSGAYDASNTSAPTTVQNGVQVPPGARSIVWSVYNSTTAVSAVLYAYKPTANGGSGRWFTRATVTLNSTNGWSVSQVLDPGTTRVLLVPASGVTELYWNCSEEAA